MPKRMVQMAGFLVFMVGCLFLSAGRWDWIGGWLLIGLWVSGVVMTWFAVMRKHPDLIAERARAGKDAKAWDKVLAPLMAAVGPVAIWVLAGLDVRYAWTHPPSPASEIVGMIIAAAGFCLITWSMAANNYFSSYVRIQKERGHQVVSSGPYHYVRHPGYVGMLAYTLATPLILGSYAAFVPAILTASVTVLRTALEDGTLRRELDGYDDYSRRVKYRLAPGVW